MICSVCQINKSSYKCPQCKEPYCCSNCYRIHKFQFCNPYTEETSKAENDNQEESIPPFELFRSQPEIINALGDPRLQEIITRIDSSEDRENSLIKEMEINQDFKKFVDKLIEKAPSSIIP